VTVAIMSTDMSTESAEVAASGRTDTRPGGGARAAGPRALDLATYRATQRSAVAALDVLPPLAPLLPAGLRRGTTVAVIGSTSLLLALLAGPSTAGSWCAVVGLPTLGVLAAAEAGVALDRFVLVPAPGADWVAASSALLDGMDLVAVAPPARVTPGDARRLAARARYRGAILVPFGEWPGADLRLSLGAQRWEGLSDGAGRIVGRTTEVRAEGRGAAARGRAVRVCLPGRSGAITDPTPEQAPDPTTTHGAVLQAVS
jgi:hypothetical protein